MATTNLPNPLQINADNAVPAAADIAGNLRAGQDRIAAVCSEVGRSADGVGLVAVGKSFPAEAARAALIAGQRLFGENRVQEAQAKWPALKAEFPDARLHLIGPLQTNKVRDAVALFDAIQTVDRPRLAQAIAAEMDRSGRRPDCFIEVNTGAETQKAGVAPELVDGFIAECRGLGLPIVGLMCIPPQGEEPALHFALLREIARRNGLAELSMGMSGDFETAVAFGATLVRIGTAIFGPRPARNAGA